MALQLLLLRPSSSIFNILNVGKMLIDFIVFLISGRIYSVELNKFSIISKLNDPFIKTAVNYLNYMEKLEYKNRPLVLLDLHSILTKTRFIPTSYSRILIGETDNKLFGFYVDGVFEYLNLDELEISKDFDHSHEYISGVIKVGKTDFEIIDIEKIKRSNSELELNV